MSEALRTLITSYQLALLDDAVAEGPHAHVSRTVRVRPAAKPWTWSFFLRLQQNIALMESTDIDTFATMF
eukprot:6722476-Alexandrium_andersonii.AAC.1